MINEEEIRKWLAIVEKCDSSSRAFEESAGLVIEHLEELVVFLNELNEFVSQKRSPRAVLQEIPSVGKFLSALSQNHIVQCSEQAVRSLFRAIISLASHNTDEIDSTTRKTIAWAQSQIKEMASPSPACSASFFLIGHCLGNTTAELTQTMINKFVLSLCHDLLEEDGTKWNPKINDLAPSIKHHGLTLRSLSEMCLPIMTEPVARPLIESLLLAGNSCSDVISCTSYDHFNVHDCLSPKFLASVTEMTRQKILDPNSEGYGYREILNYNALVALWRRYQPSFESQVLDIIEFSVILHPELSIQQVKDLMDTCQLTKACADHVELYNTALQLVYLFMYNVPNNSRLEEVLGAFREPSMKR